MFHIVRNFTISQPKNRSLIHLDFNFMLKLLKDDNSVTSKKKTKQVEVLNFNLESKLCN